MKEAHLYRMVTPEHICPFGTKSKYLLEKEGYKVHDHLLKSREETDQFKLKHGVKTTPQTFIEQKRVGGYDDLRDYFHKAPAKKPNEKSYTPVISLFGVAALMALAIEWMTHQSIEPWSALRLFGGISMCSLAVQKLKDLESFSNGFLNYDLFALKYVPYSYVYPFAELVAGLIMLSGIAPIAGGIIAILIGLEGAVSVAKAVYFDRRELKCACMGGNTNVPLGFISMTENLLMVAMGTWMFF